MGVISSSFKSWRVKHSNNDMQNVLFANLAVFLVHTKNEFLRLVSGTSAQGE